MAKSKEKSEKLRAPGPTRAEAQCACGDIAIEIAVPAQWAWHDHSAATRRAHGAAYATFVGTWRSRMRFIRGEEALSNFEEPETGAVRSFCTRCGTPVLYQRKRSPNNINIPRALFTSGVGREPRYHIAIDQLQDWTYLGEKLKPLTGYPGVVWTGAKKKRL
ncbi:MAG: GFA family protein [Hyphomonadaceae bacterium]